MIDWKHAYRSGACRFVQWQTGLEKGFSQELTDWFINMTCNGFYSEKHMQICEDTGRELCACVLCTSV